MFDFFRETSIWLWEFIVGIFTFVGTLLGDFLLAIYDNLETIVPIVLYIVVSIVGVTLLVKFFNSLMDYFKSITKDTVYGLFMALIVGLGILVVLFSFALYIDNI